MIDYRSGPGWVLMLLGLMIAGSGLLWLLGPSIPWLGRLPGDIHVGGDRFRLYLPLMTCLLLSIVLSLILWIVRSIRN